MMHTKKYLWTLILCLLSSCQHPLYDEPPLHDAAKRGNLSKVKQLISEGHRVNAVNREGATPLHWAAFKGRTEVVKYLLKKRANANARTTKGSTPLKLAQDYNQEETAKVIKRYGGR